MIAYVGWFINEELIEKQWMVLMAVVFQGWLLIEVVYCMNFNQNALYKLIFDARQQLHQHMSDDGLTPEEVIAVFGDA